VPGNQADQRCQLPPILGVIGITDSRHDRSGGHKSDAGDLTDTLADRVTFMQSFDSVIVPGDSIVQFDKATVKVSEQLTSAIAEIVFSILENRR